MDAATFRADFPEFADTTKYPNSLISFWLGVGAKLLRPERWVDLLDVGLELFTAHNLVLERQAQISVNGGGVPGMSVGVVNSKQVDKLSVGYDTSIGLDPAAGHWNLTSYGMRFYSLVRLAGMGGTQYGAGPDPNSPIAQFGGLTGLSYG